MLAAAVAGAVLSGIPSTVLSIVRRQPLLEPVRAAGALVGREGSIAAGLAAHLAISFGWTAVLARVLPRRRPIAEGAVAGLAIAALDLGVIGRRVGAIRRLPAVPQIADHVMFGVVVSTALNRSARIPV